MPYFYDIKAFRIFQGTLFDKTYYFAIRLIGACGSTFPPPEKFSAFFKRRLSRRKTRFIFMTSIYTGKIKKAHARVLTASQGNLRQPGQDAFAAFAGENTLV